jgi:hypothetical protein
VAVRGQTPQLVQAHGSAGKRQGSHSVGGGGAAGRGGGRGVGTHQWVQTHGSACGKTARWPSAAAAGTAQRTQNAWLCLLEVRMPPKRGCAPGTLRVRIRRPTHTGAVGWRGDAAGRGGVRGRNVGWEGGGRNRPLTPAGDVHTTRTLSSTTAHADVVKLYRPLDSVSPTPSRPRKPRRRPVSVSVSPPLPRSDAPPGTPTATTSGSWGAREGGTDATAAPTTSATAATGPAATTAPRTYTRLPGGRPATTYAAGAVSGHPAGRLSTTVPHAHGAAAPGAGSACTPRVGSPGMSATPSTGRVGAGAPGGRRAAAAARAAVQDAGSGVAANAGESDHCRR